MAIIKSKGNVETCPVTKETWESRAELKRADCGGGTMYHCLADYKDNKWEKCLEKTLILKGNCPVFTSDGYLDWKPCNISEASCPNSSYFSNEVYKHSWCFGKNTPTNQTSILDGSIIGIVATVVLLMIAAAVLIHFVRGRWRRLKTRERGMNDYIETKPLIQGRGAGYCKNIASRIVSVLSKKDVNFVIVTGEMDLFMVSKARDVLKICAKDLEKKPKEYLFPKVPSTVEENTLIFIYGWFGLLNDDLCSIDTAENVCKTLIEICELKPTVKVAICMRRNMFLKYSKILKNPLFSKCEHIALTNSELDKEYEDYLDTLKRDCKVNQCPCGDINSAMLKSNENEDFIGMPLKVEILSKNHDPTLIRNFIKNRDILKTVTDYLTDLARNDPPDYQWLMYICLKGYFSRQKSFDKDLIRKNNFEIKLSTFDTHFLGKLQKYLRIWYQSQKSDQTYVFGHPFIYICAFHSLFKTNKDIVMNHCRVDAILQLVRPKSMKLSYAEVAADDSDIKTFKIRLRKLGLSNKYKDHPLVRDEVQHT